MSKNKQKPEQPVDVILEEKKMGAREAIRQVANPKCSKCHGTGNRGWNSVHDYWLVCRCVLKKISIYQNFKNHQEIKPEGETL